MPHKRYKPDPAPDALHAAQLAQHLASANQNAASLAASLSRIAGRVSSGAGGSARVRMAGTAARPTGRGVPWRSAAQCGPGGCSLANAPADSSGGGAPLSGWSAGSREGWSIASGNTDSSSAGSGGGSIAGLFSSALNAALRGALRGDPQAARRGFAGALIRGLTGQLARGMGGGAFGGVFGGLIGVGLSLLAGRLLGGGGRQQLDPAPLAPLLHFPQLASLDYASNPASRLFGGRAVARGPAFRVEVSYREGAGDIVAAKVATKLGEVNGMNL